MIGFRVDIEFLWGFQCKIPGLSKSSPSFSYPPPTVFLGSLAEAISKEHHFGELEGKKLIPALSRNLLAVGIRPLNCMPVKFSDINKMIAIRRTGKGRFPSPRDPYGSFDAPSTGKTLLTPLGREAPIIRLLMVFQEGVIHKDTVDIELTEQVFWCIHRIGSKESRVSVIDVERLTPTISDGRVVTTYSYPLLGGVSPEKSIEPSWSPEDVVNPFTVESYDEGDNPVRNYLEAKKILQFSLPIMRTPNTPPEYVLNVSRPAAFYRLGDEVIIGTCPTRS